MFNKLLLCGALLLSPLGAEEVNDSEITENVFEEKTFVYENENGIMTIKLTSETDCEVVYEEESVICTYSLDENDVLTIIKEDGTEFDYKFKVDYENNTLSIYEQDKNSEWEDAKDTIIDWTTDIDGDGIPDKIKGLLDKIENTQLIGGITVGSLITLCLSLLGSYVSYLIQKKKFKAVNQANLDNANTTKEVIKKNEEIQNNINNLKNNLLTILENFVRTSNNINNTSNANTQELLAKIETFTKDIQEFETKLKELDGTNEKIEVLLDNQLKIAQNSNEMVAKGIAKDLEKQVNKLKE